MIASDTPRALIEAHVEPEVIEVFGDEAKAWADAHGRALAARLEQAGETAFCYANDPRRCSRRLPARTACATCTAPPTSRICSSS